MAVERSPAQHFLFKRALDILRPPLHSIVWIDESHIDRRNSNCKRGWSSCGMRSKFDHILVRGERFSVICGTRIEGVVAFDIIRNACDSIAFSNFMLNNILPACAVGDVVIMDNATIHKDIFWRQCFAFLGISVIFLPAYSPELNPAEWVWQALKQKLRKSYELTAFAPLLAVFKFMNDLKFPNFDLEDVALNAGYIDY